MDCIGLISSALLVYVSLYLHYKNHRLYSLQFRLQCQHQRLLLENNQLHQKNHRAQREIRSLEMQLMLPSSAHKGKNEYARRN